MNFVDEATLPAGVEPGIGAAGEPAPDIAEQRRAEALHFEQGRILERIATGASLEECLTALAAAVPRLHPLARAGVLLADEGRTKIERYFTADDIPPSFGQGVQGVPINELAIGTCSTAMFCCEPVTCPDIAGSGDRWSKEWRDLCAAHNVAAVRSTPVLRPDGQAIGSFFIGFPEPHEPDAWDLRIAEFGAHIASIAVERDRAVGALVRSERRLAAELDAMRHLQSISTRLIQEDDADKLYEHLVEAAKEIMRADAASMQVLDSEKGALRLVAWQGFHPDAAQFWQWVRPDSGSSCGAAILSGERVTVADTEACPFMAGTADLDHYRLSGLLAVQSTPLVSRSGQLLGMISTHWRRPHQPGDSELRLLDVLARQAADLIERRHADEALRRRAAQLKLLTDELNHRVKNTLATVQSIALQTLRNAPTAAAGREALEARLVALSHAHDLLTRENWEGGDLGTVVGDALSAYSVDGEASRFEVVGPAIRLRPKAVLALSLALQELVTNAVKYGALSNHAGSIRIEWDSASGGQGQFRFQWRENGGPPVEPPRRRGFGSRLIQRGLAQDIGGAVDLRFAREGVVCTIEAPLDEVRATAISAA